MIRDIYAALPEQFIMRMKNWARANSGAGVYASTSAFNYSRGGAYTSSFPVLVGEADDTGKALSALPVRYQQAVSLFWQYEGRSMMWFASRSGLGVSVRTIERRVICGHDLLRAEIARQHALVLAYKASAVGGYSLTL